ncbi:MAG TPA: carboxylesterase family protein [Streptosporangiaceae bacterium]|nr:carboxylesterase family protein [Streptosporangiaceae bacterium]
MPGRGLLVAPADGLVHGKSAAGTDEFLGIPYAPPPVGALRWQPPQPAARWRGVRQATAFAPHCPQPPSDFGVASTSENCLYLNVYAPAHAASLRGLPVMVWVHGGSLLVGESDDCNPAALVRRGVGRPRAAPVDRHRAGQRPVQPQVETDFSAEHHCGFWSLAEG